MTSFKKMVASMSRLFRFSRGVTIAPDAVTPIPPPPAKQPREGHYIEMKYTPNNYDLTPSHYVRNGLAVVTPNDLTNRLAVVGLQGAACWYYWSELEPTLGNYNFATIEADMLACEAAGKRLIVMIVDRTFLGNDVEPLPAYLRAYSLPSKSQRKVNGVQVGWGKSGARWIPYYRDRFTALVNAIQSEYSTRALEAISTEETALGLSTEGGDPTQMPWKNGLYGAAEWYPNYGPTAESPYGETSASTPLLLPVGDPNAVRYSATAYCNAFRDIILNSKATRPTSRFLLSQNYWAYGQDKNGPVYKMLQDIAASDGHHAMLGGPDLLPPQAFGTAGTISPAKGLNGVAYPRGWKQAYDLGLGLFGQAQFNNHRSGDPPYSATYTAETAVTYTPAEVFTWGTTAGDNAPGHGNSHGWAIRYMLWTNVERGSGFKFNFDDDVIPVINANPTWPGCGSETW